MWGDVCNGGGGGDVLRLSHKSTPEHSPRCKFCNDIVCDLGGHFVTGGRFAMICLRFGGTFCYRGTCCNDCLCDLGGCFVMGECFATIVCVIWVDVMCGETFCNGLTFCDFRAYSHQRRAFFPSRFVRTRAFTHLSRKNAGRHMNTSAVIGLDVITC